MARLIDSSTLITPERRRVTADKVSQLLTADSSAIASITASEMLVGAYQASTTQRRQLREAFFDIVLSTLPVLPFDLEAARIYARVWAELSAVGQMIGPHDLLIAATALAHGYSVLTENFQDFERVPGLTVQRPDS